MSAREPGRPAAPTASDPPCSSELMAVVRAIEARHPVLDWTVEGLPLWPLLRMDGFMREWARHHAPRDPAGGLRRLEPLRRLLLGPVNAWRAARQHPGSVAPVDAPAEVLLLSDGVSLARLGAVQVEKFCDPLRRGLSGLGLNAAVWSLGHGHAMPRAAPVRLVQPAFDRAKLRGVINARLGRVRAQLPGQAALLGELGDWPGLRAALAEQAVVSLGARLAALVAHLTPRLRRIRPGLVMVVSYYGLEGMALVAACRRLGIPTVDVQHGVQGPLHPAYAGWPPPGAGRCHALLPDRFMVWSAQEAGAIADWAQGSGHAAVVGGHPWAEVWREGAWPGMAEARARAQALRAQAQGRPCVLVSLQPGLTPALLPRLLDLARRTEGRYSLWLRLHPAMLGEREALRAAVAGVAGMDLDASTDLPLPALLPACDLHLTHSSSVVLEAAALGVASVLTSRYGAELYPDCLAAGLAVRDEGDAASLAGTIDALLARRAARPAEPEGRMALALASLVADFGVGQSPHAAPAEPGPRP